MKAIGEQVRAPAIERNLFNLSPILMVNPTATPTSKVLVKFLHHCLFFDFGHPLYSMVSITICAGYSTNGKLKNRLSENNITIPYPMMLLGRLSVIRS